MRFRGGFTTSGVALTVTFILAGMFLPAAAPVIAQTLDTGTWTGTVAPSAADAQDVSYEVSRNAGGELRIRLVLAAGSVGFEDVAYDGSVLTFKWRDGNMFLTCVLERLDDGSFEGACSRESRDPTGVTMVPPKN